MNKNLSWGNYPQIAGQEKTTISGRHTNFPEKNKSVLPRGLGRSYGDSCLNENGILIGTENLKHYITFDKEQGVITCEAGISFAQILELTVPYGWFLPVTPGTKFVTVGGAIANDVHGKNHHSSGNFGNHILSFELLRSDNQRILCSASENSDYFYATIGGLGLTGVITWASFRLKKITSAWIEQEQIQFNKLEEFLMLSVESEKNYEYTVSWVDCVNSKDDIRGIFIRGNHAQIHSNNFQIHSTKSIKRVPFYLPNFILNKFTIKLFNHLYFRKNLSRFKKNTVHYDPFFYPLDSIHDWNRIYGKRGFLQYQFVIPYKNDGGKALKEVFSLLQKSQMGSFLAILKTFGPIESLGILSFPKEGVTLALDFPNYGEALYKVLEACDEIVRSVGGRIYPAKDARMTKTTFSAGYDHVDLFEKFKDPSCSSSFWRRVR